MNIASTDAIATQTDNAAGPLLGANGRPIDMAAAHAELAKSDPPIIDVGGRPHMRDGKGHLVPIEQIKAQQRLEDETVRDIFAFAQALSDQISRFRDHTLGDIGAFLDLLDQKYGARRGGEKGNVTLQSYDGLLKVQLQVADLIAFGPELQTAKALVDECLVDWIADAKPQLAVIVQRAFAVDKEGQINRSALLSLLRYEMNDERWTRAMDALRDSIRPIGTKEYVRFHRRATPKSAWERVSINVAAV